MKITPYLFKNYMARYLAIFTDNHNEEFDVHGFRVMTEKEVATFEELATSITWEFTYCANSECLTFSNGEDFLSRFEFKEITKDEFINLEKIFNGEFGTFIGEEVLETILDGEGELDDEDFDDEDEENDY